MAGLDPPQRRQRTLEALKHLLLRESQVQPVCLMFEDLHWIDAETQALLDSLVESPDGQAPPARQLPSRVPARLGLEDVLHPAPARPTAPASADEFLQALLGDDPSLAPLAAADRPYPRESVLSGREHTHPRRDRGSRRRARRAPAGQAGGELQVPATVQAVLAARIDRLPRRRSGCSRPPR